MGSVVLVGLQWGDEGKGKVSDLLSESVLHVVRSQGGNNAGHTIVFNNTDYRFHLVPSGMLHPGVKAYIGGGTVVDPKALTAELAKLSQLGVSHQGRLFLSRCAHLIFPYHRLLDGLSERRKGSEAVGTTMCGIGPCYVDKAARQGLRVADLLERKNFRGKLEQAAAWKNEEISRLYGQKPLDVEEIIAEYEGYRPLLEALAAPVEEMLAEAMAKKEPVLFEGAQGAMLDGTFGSYPFVTSSSTLSGGSLAGAGLGPKGVGRVLGVAKAYATRVGQGPFPTELSAEEYKRFPGHVESREIGVTTGRKRRLGWLDLYALRHAVLLNGADGLALTKLDILDHLEEILICVGYRISGKELSSFPASVEEWESAEPVYEALAGWKEPTGAVRRKKDLPNRAQIFLDRIEEFCRCPIALVSVGPSREQTIWIDPIFQKKR